MSEQEQIQKLRDYIPLEDDAEIDQNMIEMVEPFLDSLKALVNSELFISPGINGDIYLTCKVQDQTDLIIKIESFRIKKYPFIEGTVFFADRRVVSVEQKETDKP